MFLVINFYDIINNKGFNFPRGLCSEKEKAGNYTGDNRSV